MKSARLLPMLFASLLSASAHAVTIEWVTVSDPGNAADTTGYGAVPYEYQIGKYEVTIGQYTEFLNATAKSDPYSLWAARMVSDISIAGIVRSGTSGSYAYFVTGPLGLSPAGASSPGNRPISCVSWFDAARFANWMHNGQLSGTAGAASTETGAYTLNGVTSGTAPAKNPDARFYIPTEDQWYKAAYFKGGGTNMGYWEYATQSDTPPGNAIGGSVNQANYRLDGTTYSVTQVPEFSPSQNYLTDVGAYTNSQSAYGTFDQSGNISEWNDLSGLADLTRGVRGGLWDFSAFSLAASNRFIRDPTSQSNDIGFRLASPVPEPATSGAMFAALAIGCYSLFRHRKCA
jgi:sulfatase modifying factor 1